MARPSSLLSKVWIHSSLVLLPLEAEDTPSKLLKPSCPVKLRSPNSSVDEEEREARKYASFLNYFFFPGLSYNDDIQLLWKSSSNSNFLTSVIIIPLIPSKRWVSRAGAHADTPGTARFQGRSGSALQVALHIQYAHAQHYYSVCHRYLPASQTLPSTIC